MTDYWPDDDVSDDGEFCPQCGELRENCACHGGAYVAACPFCGEEELIRFRGDGTNGRVCVGCGYEWDE